MKKLPWYCVLPLFVLLALTCTNVYLLDYFKVHDLALEKLPALQEAKYNITDLVRDWTARHLIQVGTVAFFFSATLVTGSSWYVILKSLAPFQHRKIFALGTLLLGSLIFVILWTTVPIDTLNDSLAKMVQNRTGIALDRLYDYMHCTGISLLVWVTAAYTSVLVPDYRDKDTNKTTKSDEAFLHDRMIWTRTVLYTASILFCVILAYHYGVTRWPVIYIADKEAQEAVRQLSHYSTMRFGFYYTLVLISVYLPAEVVLRLRANKLARDAGVEDMNAMDGWLKARGLRLSLLEEAPHTIAVVSPLIAGISSQIT